jgi:hypothetical protein
VLAWLEVEPATLVAVSPRAQAAVLEALAEHLAASAVPPSQPALEHATAETGDDVESTGLQPALPDSAREEARPATAQQPRLTTRYGGLLFLLLIIGDLGIPTEAAAGALEERPLRWVLLKLAQLLAPVEWDDPAALAFAGLLGERELAAEWRSPPEAAEVAALAGLAERVTEHLRERLDRPHPPPDELLDFVCRRRAEIVYDSGWLELRLPLSEVSLDLRRAGLDLDPGWLPWLGTVVRFVYE